MQKKLDPKKIILIVLAIILTTLVIWAATNSNRGENLQGKLSILSPIKKYYEEEHKFVHPKDPVINKIDIKKFSR